MANYATANNLYESGRKLAEKTLYGIKEWCLDFWRHESEHDTECPFFCNNSITILPGIRAPHHACVGYSDLEIPFQKEPECEDCEYQGKVWIEYIQAN